MDKHLVVVVGADWGDKERSCVVTGFLENNIVVIEEVIELPNERFCIVPILVEPFELPLYPKKSKGDKKKAARELKQRGWK